MLKGVSFLPRPNSLVSDVSNDDYAVEESQLAAVVQPYAQMPYERISGRQYRELVGHLRAPVFFHEFAETFENEDNPTAPLFCENDRCSVVPVSVAESVLDE